MQGYTEKLEYHLFIGKVAEIIGQEKTLELLKETKEAIKKANQHGQEKNT